MEQWRIFTKSSLEHSQEECFSDSNTVISTSQGKDTRFCPYLTYLYMFKCGNWRCVSAYLLVNTCEQKHKPCKGGHTKLWRKIQEHSVG